MSHRNFGHRLSVLGLLCLTVLLGACTQRKSLDAYFAKMQQDDPVAYAEMVERGKLRDAQRTEVLPVSITCIEHGDLNLGAWYAQEIAYGQISRGMVGGSFSCGGVLALGYPVPLVWKPGLKVKVRWSTYGPVTGKEPTWHEKETTILPYARVGSVYVHLFPGNEVRVVVASNDAISPSHPIPRDSVVPPPEIE